jgi:serine/threonine protein kinase
MAESNAPILTIGTVLDGKWVILDLIGRGGMGEVYRAHQINLKRDVAIKIVSQECLKAVSSDEEEIESTLARFRREVQAMAQIRHPNVLQIFDYGSTRTPKEGETTPVEYIAIEYVPGATLRAAMSEEGFYPDEDRMKAWLTDYFLPVLDGVQAIHALGMVHRDLKPENVLLDGATPKISDFGLARSCRLKSVTRDIDIKGTPPYMPPEQFFDFGHVDQRADIYSLGKILYEAVCGKMPPTMIPFKKVCLINAESAFYQGLDRIIQQATAEDPKDRIPSAQVLTQAITELVGGEKASAQTPETLPPSSPRARRAHYIAAVLALLLLGSAIFGIAHYIGMKESATPSGASIPLPPETKTTTSPSNTNSLAPLQTLTGQDGETLDLVPPGTVKLPLNLRQGAGESVTVPAFYMDETAVTNHQYVEFLNKVRAELKVDGGVVRRGDEIWLLLGEVMKGYEPIIYKHGKFRIKDPVHASCPVLRVTGYGAAAYARFYGRRLPTVAEWLLAFQNGKEPSETAPGGSGGRQEGVDAMHAQMHGEAPGEVPPSTSRPFPSPVLLSKPNRFGIRGLDGQIAEWALTSLPAADSSGDEDYVVLGAAETDPGKGPAAVLRHPWEAFEDVGFRCVLSTSVAAK